MLGFWSPAGNPGQTRHFSYEGKTRAQGQDSTTPGRATADGSAKEEAAEPTGQAGVLLGTQSTQTQEGMVRTPEATLLESSFILCPHQEECCGLNVSPGPVCWA